MNISRQLTLSGQNGVLSARAAMGKDTPLELVVSNDGTPPPTT